jgi:hypothetical protein
LSRFDFFYSLFFSPDFFLVNLNFSFVQVKEYKSLEILKKWLKDTKDPKEKEANGNESKEKYGLIKSILSTLLVLPMDLNALSKTKIGKTVKGFTTDMPCEFVYF